jgi:hypothetical protein
MKKYPSIEQFRNVIKSVKMIHDYKGRDEDGKAIYGHTENYPTLKFIGTVKLHGTNAGVVKYADGRIEYQSRERVLSLGEDNAGFMEVMASKDLSFLFSLFQFSESVAVFGEWCGGNIQKGVAINGLEKMFVIFGVMVDNEWVSIPEDMHDESQNIYNVNQFSTYEIDIDFNYPELSQNRMIEMTVEVEDKCPVGAYFGKDGVGEGIVFTCVSDPSLKFKSKGEKHSVSRVKKLNPIDVESVAGIKEFIESAVTEARLEQGISFFKENNIEVDSKNTGAFLSWIVKDILKEESDTIAENGLDEKRVKSAIVTKARAWFLNHL